METVNGFVPMERHSVTGVMGSVCSSNTLCGWRFSPNTRCARTHFFLFSPEISISRKWHSREGHSETCWMSHILRRDLVTA